MLNKNIFVNFVTHLPVLLNEVVHYLNLKPHGVYIDATFGGGGYARAILDFDPTVVLIANDRDPQAIERARELQKEYPSRLRIHHGTFMDLPTYLNGEKVDGVVFDFGVSSFQIDTPERGFSLRFDGPLDMRMSLTGISAQEVVNTFKEEEIADILYHYGEEKKARRIAKAIVQARSVVPIQTTIDLVKIVESVYPTTKSAKPPATQTFQALRIFVNNELIEIENALKDSISYLKTGGRMVAVTFHSLEDQIVKNFLRPLPGGSRYLPTQTVQEKELFPVERKAVVPTSQEVEENPRARSAKLRVGEKRG